MRIYTLLVTLLIVVSGCSKKENSIDVSNIEASVDVHRFDQKFYSATAENYNSLKDSYPYLFPEMVADSVWLNKISNKDELELFTETEKLYNDFSVQESKIEDMFKHIKYYYPNFMEPKVITLLTNVDSENKVILADSLLLVSLDCYLGSEHEFYDDFPNYIKQNFNEEDIIVDIAKEFAKQIVPGSEDKSFVGRIVQEGKILEIMHRFLPREKANDIMQYTVEQELWANENESSIWKYFIEKEMIFSNNSELSDRFIIDAPFSKFYIANDQDSPGRIGVWFGWQIVQSYMQNNDVSFIEMLTTPNEKIFKKSKYKPKK